LWPATLVHQDCEYPCTVLDVSELGARVETKSVEFRPARVVLRSERFGSLEGWLLWSRNGQAGIRFDRPADEVHQLLKPLVPGMDRKKMTGPTKSPRQPRQHFGRLPRTTAADVTAPIADAPGAGTGADVSASESVEQPEGR
jgi:hypothetical protein